MNSLICFYCKIVIWSEKTRLEKARDHTSIQYYTRKNDDWLKSEIHICKQCFDENAPQDLINALQRSLTTILGERI